MKRMHVNKHRSAKQFKHKVGHTHGKNMAAPMRGGWRL